MNRRPLSLATAVAMALALQGCATHAAAPTVAEWWPAGPADPVAQPAGLAGMALVRQRIIEVATGALGTRYRLGGRGAPGDGFDCSGLIQYAYAQNGFSLPRRSVDQARAGRAVPKQPEALLPGDILAFSSRRGPVTHVGIYMGDGRFIHSASRGVRVSLLSPDDPDGRWWWRRWVGVRRVVDDE